MTRETIPVLPDLLVAKEEISALTRQILAENRKLVAQNQEARRIFGEVTRLFGATFSDETEARAEFAKVETAIAEWMKEGK